jgi:hypothetical protein
MTFLFLHQGVHYLGDRHPRHTHPGAELLGAYKKIQDAQAQALLWNIVVVSLLQKSWTGHTPAGRERIRAAKLGMNNPNAQGLSQEHRKRIAQTMRAQRRGEHHHFYNMRHSARSRLKISLGMKQRGARRWVLSPANTEHFIYLPFVLPEGWTWGRKRMR